MLTQVKEILFTEARTPSIRGDFVAVRKVVEIQTSVTFTSGEVGCGSSDFW